MKVLGIESSAHTFGVGVWDGERIAANEKAFYKPKKGGIHPRKAADFLAENAGEVLGAAVKKGGVKLADFDAFAFTAGPGLGPCLQVGAAAAKSLAARFGKPLVPVNHCVAHIEVTKFFTGMKDPVVVYVSGGNTQILILEEKRYRVLGETLDIGLGNLLDSFGREMGLEWAHGSVIEELARKGRYVPLPYTVKGMDLAFTGLLTHAQRMLSGHSKEDVCHSLQETAFAMLCEATERAVAMSKRKEVVACGGVAQNSRLQEMLRKMCEERGAMFAVGPNEYNADNGGMIAYTGLLMKKAGMKFSAKDFKVRQRFRADEVEVSW